MKSSLLKWGAIFFWMVTLIVQFNTNFGLWTQIDYIETMADAPHILQGYYEIDSPFKEGLKWWHGPWIETGIQVFRPLSSIFFWYECHIGLQHGFIWIARFGVLLFTAVCVLAVALSFRATRSYWCAFLAATLIPLVRLWNMGGSQPHYWLAWFPVHHDLLTMGFLGGALLCFDYWLESKSSKALIGTWACFLIGALCKEYVYLFPLLALIWASFRGFKLSRTVWIQIGTLFTFALILFLYRMLVLPSPYNPPPLKMVHMIKRPFLYWFAPYYKYVLSEMWWVVALAFSTFLGLLNWSKVPKKWGLLPRFGLIIAFLFLVGLQSSLLDMPADQIFWYFAEPTSATLRMNDLISMIFLLWAMVLIWKYRKEQPTLAVLGVFLVSYLPVWTYLGWHYCLVGAFIRAALWWPMILKISSLEIARSSLWQSKIRPALSQS